MKIHIEIVVMKKGSERMIVVIQMRRFEPIRTYTYTTPFVNIP